MKPMLAHVYEPDRVTYPLWLQPKLNGVRALCSSGYFQSRDEFPWNPKVLLHLAVDLQRLFPPTMILDGELYKHGWPLQRINGAISIARHEPIPDTEEIEYHIFDCIDFSLSFLDRLNKLRQTIHNQPLLFAGTKIRLVPTIRCPEEIDAEVLYAKWVKEGYEGCMYRTGLCPYTYPKQLTCHTNHLHAANTKFLSDKNNRSWHLLKRKSWMDDEFEIVAVEEGEGKRQGMVGAFVCLTKEGNRFRVGSGLSDIWGQVYFQNQPIGRKCKVKFLNYTRDGIPFNPTIEAIL